MANPASPPAGDPSAASTPPTQSSAPGPVDSAKGKGPNTASPASSPNRTRSRGGGGQQRRGASNNRASSPTDERKPQQQPQQQGGQHSRKSSRSGGAGHARRGSSSGGQSGQQQQQPQQQQQGARRSSPVETRDQSPASGRNASAQGHRKSGSFGGSANAAPPPAPLGSIPAVGGASLNPTAGGFNPNSLGPIHDMIDEGLVTPTASRFDLMTGMPAGSQGGYQPQQQAYQHHAPQRNFVFPPPAAPPIPQVPMAGLAAPVSAAGTTELLAEQLAIQQQLENLRLQQESLMARFGDMQASLVGQTGQPGQPQPQVSQAPYQAPTSAQQTHHRRLSSTSVAQPQPTGAMGSFGMPYQSPASAGIASGSQAGGSPYGHQKQTSLSGGVPLGHGRRHSVQTQGATSGLGGGFQFPPRGPGAGQQQQQQQQQNQSPYGQQQSQQQGVRFNEDEGGFYSGNDSPSTGRVLGHHRRTSGSMSSLGGWQQTLHQAGSANLAEASAHLQALGAYRASAGHGRVPSFGMSAIGPGGQGGPGQLAMAGYGGGIPQPGMGMGGQGGGNQNQMRKTLFAPYLPQASIPPLLAAGQLVVGTLRVNKRNRSDAYVANEALDTDIYICGSKDRNRALEGDVVAVELLEVDDVWGTKKDKEEKKRKKEEMASYDPKATRDLRKQDKKKDDVEVEGQGLLLFEDEEVTDEQKPQYAGHVVAVLERAPGQLFSGTLGVLRPSSAATQQKQDAERREREGVDLRGGGGGGHQYGDRNGHSSYQQQAPKIIWFRPTDKRVPLIAIPTDQAPADFVQHSERYQDRLFVACIKRWPITSLHPFGQLVEELGAIGEIETETSALLKDCNFSAEDFSEAVQKCLPPTPWSIPEREIEPDIRRDLRQHRVFTIDPETAKDLDDALHIVKNDDGTYEVGVHIADVSHFVKPNTALDREARKRATTVYLVQRAVPMLPPTLSEQLCSLNAGADKLTFSVIFTLTPEGQILSTWFGKTVINSKAKLAYSDAQEVIDKDALPEGKVDDAELRKGIEDDVRALAAIAKQLRARRFDSGALRIDNVKVSFRLDEFGLPVDAREYVRKEANELIEEFMLMANIAVAGKIASGLPDQALLRRHEAPIDRRLDAFVTRMKKLGIDLDGSSSGTLMKSIGDVTDSSERLTLQHLSTRAMHRAKYFCTGTLDISRYGHYALNVPLYTHFTSPIRRYADVIVHRQLEAVLQSHGNTLSGGASEPRFSLDTEMISKIASTCNTKKDAARLAQEQSQHLFLCILIEDLTKRFGPVVRYGTVIGVLDQAFDVLVSEFGVEKRVHMDQIPTESTVYDERENALQIFWKRGVDVLAYLTETNEDEHLKRLRAHAQHHAKLMEADSGKGDAENALFDDDDDEADEAGRGPGGAVKRVLDTEQHRKSRDRAPLAFEGLSSENGHCSQTVKTLQRVPVVISADCTRSPPVIRMTACNPYA
ncbi:hypothetical protein BMF94_7023 [Rhodotorula taiwanensis]|uniref:DIS3-like exonuclease 2 n=1 Tax=Rhodotorula taiwanensis TaxID=741276 RepID=A0A2S5AZM2_9BASI|nr:hypothetical protein BMF94_7023 [Rhodotorula taiwanensis]